MTKINYAEEFEKMRPYRDQEVNDAIRRLVSYPEFNVVLGWLFPEVPLEKSKHDLLQINGVEEFQVKFMHKVVNTIIAKTSSGLTVSGMENLTPGTAYLFVSNHRDIVLDAAILQVILLDYGHKTSQITFGNNLMSSPMIVDFGKLNRMFTFYRGGSKLEMYKNALLHSAYIRDAIVNLNESIWIAQRNGRTKDGNDLTQSALLKMFIGCQPDPVQSLSELNIVPMAVSYEYEPCDIQKVNEIYLSGIQEYVKSKNEDFLSVLSGITSFKGKIHFSFGTPLNAFLDSLQTENLNQHALSEKVAAEIDRQIYQMFRLQPVNFIAADMLGGTSDFNHHYSALEYDHFSEYLQKKISPVNGEKHELTRLMLSLYAKPVENSLKKY